MHSPQACLNITESFHSDPLRLEEVRANVHMEGLHLVWISPNPQCAILPSMNRLALENTCSQAYSITTYAESPSKDLSTLES